MMQDHMARRPAEIDNINGAIPREGSKVGVATPVNSLVVAVLKARETSFKVDLPQRKGATHSETETPAALSWSAAGSVTCPAQVQFM